MTRTVLLISGMKSSRCREAVSEAIESVGGVREVTVNLFRAEATILHEPSCAPGAFIEALEQKGFGATQG